jgi:hypothetical protein
VYHSSPVAAAAAAVAVSVDVVVGGIDIIAVEMVSVDVWV